MSRAKRRATEARRERTDTARLGPLRPPAPPESLPARPRDPRLVPALFSVLALLLTLRAFLPMLGWGFTDGDALADVAVGARPLADQLTMPLTGGYGGGQANFWRPAVMLQFWLLRHLFGWSAMGYHAWDLGLHLLCCALAGRFVAQSARFVGRDGRGLAAGTVLLFAVYPLAAEVVPAVARDIDLLLGVGFFGTLGALVDLEAARRDGRSFTLPALAFVGFFALSLGAKEAAVLLLPVAAAWVALHRDDLAPRARVGEMAQVLAVPALLTVLYLVARTSVLGGLGGYYAAEDLGGSEHLGRAFLNGPLEILLPSLSDALAPLEGARGVAMGVVLWGGAAFLLRKSEVGRLLAVGAVFLFLYAALLGVTGAWSRRVLYLPSFFVCLGMAELLRDAWHQRKWAGGVAFFVWGVSWVHGSPAVLPYADWADSASATEVLAKRALYADLPEGATVYLVDRCSRVEGDPRRHRLFGGTHSQNWCATNYSYQAWIDDVLAEKHITLHTLTGGTLAPTDLIVPATVRALPGRVEVDRPMARAGTGREGLVVKKTPGGIAITAESALSNAWLLIWQPEHPTLLPTPDPA